MSFAQLTRKLPKKWSLVFAVLVLALTSERLYFAWNRYGPGAHGRADRLLLEAHQLLEQARLQAAEQKLRACLELDPQRHAAALQLADVLFTQGRREEVRTLIWQVYPYSREQLHLLNMIWGTYHDERLSEHFSRAYRILEQSLETEPVFENRRGLAVTLMLRGTPQDLARAEPLLRLCRRERPDDLQTSLGLVQCLMELQKTNEAAAVLDELPRDWRDQPEILRLHARLALARDQAPAALLSYQKLLGQAPADLEALNQLGLLSRKQGNNPQSRSYLDRFQKAAALRREGEKLLEELEPYDDTSGEEIAAKCRRLAEITEQMGRPDEALAWKELAVSKIGMHSSGKHAAEQSAESPET